MAKTPPVLSRSVVRTLLYAGLFILLAVVVFQQKAALGDSLNRLSRTDPWFTLAGLGVLLLSVLASAGVYGALSPKPLNFWRTALVQTAGLGVNRLLPAGSGALGVSYLYLRANKLTKTMAATIAAANNLLGFGGHILLLLTACILWPSSLSHFHNLSLSSFSLALVGGGLIVVGVAVLWLVSTRSSRFASLRPLFARPSRLIIALWCSLAITLCYITAVMLAAQAFGYTLSPAAALIVLSFGVAAASAIPIPGGVGAAEAGLYFGLHSYGLSDADALAIAVLYRTMTFWLPLLVGAIAFGAVAKLNLLRTKAHA
jgi:uncharacterized membrane protein YbhN (UPF0104 family)